jgi:polysaccharide deacetylase family protein (PEP-CTERM system associated)
MMNILTFDIEEWFHILDNDSTKTEKEWSNYEYRLEYNMNKIFELLDKKNQKATFFCLGWVAREFPQVLKKINDYGYEIATHSDRHQLAYEQSKDKFKIDLEKSIKSIEDITGVKVKSYRAPGFSIKEENKWVFEELINQGIEIDCSVFPAKRSHGGFESYGHASPSIIDIAGLNIKEFPINIFEIGGKNMIFSGGGYFRLLPYWMIKLMMKKSEYVMTYFHPRDFDKKQPMIDDLSLVRKFKSYYGLGGAFDKLERLITDFEFIDLQESDNRVNWNKCKRIKL